MKDAVTWPLRAGVDIDAGSLFVLKMHNAYGEYWAYCLHIGTCGWLCVLPSGLMRIIKHGLHKTFDPHTWECICYIDPKAGEGQQR